MGTISYPTFEEFNEIHTFLQQFRCQETGNGKLTAQHPTENIKYEAFLAGVKIYELRQIGYARPPMKTDILDKPMKIESLGQFAWMLYCKLKQRRELIFTEPKAARETPF
jgi:hypothetical protein